ncbi:competence protein ComEC [Butyrivibrio sp. ob235]|uniref:DNA internalization-related competence protein ComEC/Rec2 n=1 Tax=Butyrivibrio sp. ob235 TaxID=1761780 RepID=UPI0008B33244|nr:DNA internalization-related competence protein ComEC/Rec2 [Butyrivibrio sp. ob235]SEL45226.1 competence protein ComEC [Butyrivibrio sp. ob235]
MKRPLCAVGGLFAAAVFFLLLVIQMQEGSELPDRAVVTITGTICGKEEKISSYTGEKQIVLYLKKEDGRKIMLYLDDAGYKLPMGCILKVSGKVRNFPESRNPGEFDSRSYYRILKIEYSLTDVKILGIGGRENVPEELLYRVKQSFEEILDRTMNSEDSGVMKAILLGDKNWLSDDIKDAFKKNGIIHIIAVSGVHISIIGMSLYRLLRKVGVKIPAAAAISVIVMLMYGVMCGMSASAFRAIVMFAVHLGADIIGRTYDMLSAMSLSGIMLLVSCPLYLKHSGFLMSFGAVIAIGYVLPVMPDTIRTGKLKFMAASLSIMLVTLPVNMCFYYTYPVYSIVLNLFVLPLMSVLILLGIAAIIFGYVFLPAGIVSGIGCHLILKWFLLCCNTGSSIPGNTWYAGHPEIWQVLIYLILLGAFVIIKLKTHKPVPSTDSAKRRLDEIRERKFDIIRHVFLFAGLCVLCLRIRPELRITALDVGQGDGIVIETKTANYLIDGGSTSKKQVAKYQLIPFLSYQGIGRLDAVIMTHEDEDHVSGILELFDEVEKYKGAIKIDNLILPKVGDSSKGEKYRTLEEKARELGINVSYIGREDKIRNRDVEIECLGPVKNMITDEPNAYSTVLYIKKGSFKGLFTGDVDGVGQDNLRAYVGAHRDEFADITLLKVAHHGSRYTTDEAFLDIVHPKVAFISCAQNSQYHHPHKELLERLDNIGAKTYITAQNGAITALVNDKNVKIKTYLD